MSATHPMVLPRQGTTLLIVDVQERLFPAMDADHREEVMRNIKILVTTARRLGLPVVATEQYPKGLGHTLPELRDTLGPEVQPVPKVNFSCWRVEEVRARLKATGTRQVILAGIEAHVCVLHTALDLLASDFRVYIAADACASRYPADRDMALRRLERAGAIITTAETAVFEWLGGSTHPQFKAVSALVQERMRQISGRHKDTGASRREDKETGRQGDWEIS